MIQSQRYRDPPPGMPLVLALFSFRYDAHLVPDLVENLRPIVHGHIAWDDRAADAALSNEPARRRALLEAARQQGAGWILAADPDERFEDRLADRLPDLVAQGDDILWRFRCHEMFGPTHWRADGLWGGKRMVRLFPAAAAAPDPAEALHGGWVADPGRFRQKDAGIGFYHLRMAHPARRRLRRDLYAAADPGRRHQSIGYDYLNDERGMVLLPVPEGRGFSPPFAEDGGLWAPDPGDIGPAGPDPFESRLAFAAANLPARAGATAALCALSDLADASPADADLRHAAARAALRAGQADLALDWAMRLIDRDGGDLHAHMLRAAAAGRTGQAGAAHESLGVLERAFGPSPLIGQLRARALPQEADLAGPGALWRRWVTGPARLHEGAGLAGSAVLAVVVIGFRAQAGLAAAVRSILAQDGEAAEVVVVNSGGGDCRADLAAMLGRIRLIEVEEPLFVGAARNIGIDASRAPFVAFLAGDCTAEPGWVTGRLRHHRAGAAMVSSPVLPGAGGGPVALASHLLTYGARHPALPPGETSHYGRSYARWILEEAGAFPPGLRMGEDDRMNRLTDRLSLPVWAAEVAVRHRGIDALLPLLRDERARGARRADHPPYRAQVGTSEAARRLEDAARARLLAGARAARAVSGLTGRALESLLATQWVIQAADRAGLAEALDRLARADARMAQATTRQEDEPGRALTLAEEALALDGQDWRKPLLVARLRHALGLPGAGKLAARAAVLDPQRAEPVLAMADWRQGAGDPGASRVIVETALCRAPGSGVLWRKAAELSLTLDQPEQARAFLRAALALAPGSAALHERLADAHRRAGDGLQAALRALSARRIHGWNAGRHQDRTAG